MIDFNKLNDFKKNRELSKANDRHPIKVVQGDLVKVAIDEKVGCIVNAANGLGVMGAGIAKAIKIAAGNEVEYQAKSYIRSVGPHRAGQMYMTTSGALHKHGINYILHAVTMAHWDDVLRGKSGTVEECGAAFRECLEQIANSPVQDFSIAAPALGVGRGRLSKKEIAEEMISHAIQYPYIRVVLVDRDIEMVEWWNKVLRLIKI